MALVFNKHFDPRHGEAIAIAPGVRRVTAPNAGPYTFHGTNSFLVGEAALAVIDPGPDDPHHIEALMRAIGGARVEHILLTHAHRDHSGAARKLSALTGAPVSAGRTTVAADATADIGTESRTRAEFKPDVMLTDGALVRGQAFSLQALATPGHASDHFVFALLDRDILFSGDHVMGWSTTVVAPPEGSMSDYMASLDRLIGRPEQLYLPGHGPEISAPHAHLRALKSHRRMRERAILEGLARGDRTIGELVVRIYRDVEPRLHGAAALSTLAHLEDLAARGLVESEGAPRLDARYRVAATFSAPGAVSS
jgi:glyoxylase-like metal-dependent hydrolase (beta-lactamase superfamily II)